MGERPVGHGQWDAGAVLGLADRLRSLRARVDDARVSDEQRRRWQTRLAAISAGASGDLERATAQLGRLEADVDRADRH